jgi:hypothetical protein
MGKLNPKQIENLTKTGTYEDGDGLRLVVKATGRKSWVLRFQLNGKRREMGLGSFPEVSLKAARIACAEQRKLLTAGADPMAARDAERERQREAQRQQEANRRPFEVLALEYMAAHGASWTDQWRKGWRSKLERYAFPVIGKLPASAIETEQVLRVLQPIWSAKTRTADEVRVQIERVLDAAKAQKLRSGDNPARWRGHLESLLSKTENGKTCQSLWPTWLRAKTAIPYHLELLQQKEAASKRPKKQTKTEDRNVAIYLMLRYVPSEDDMSEEELREYEPPSQAQVCKFFDEERELAPGTSEREYRKWANETTAELKERGVSRAVSAMLNIFSDS